VKQTDDIGTRAACRFLAASLLTLALFSSAPAWGIEGLPGSTWGQLSYDHDRLVGAGAMGFINQGIDWVKLPGGITLNTFLEFRYRLRNENRDFYNAYGEAVGLELKKPPFRLGVDYYWERFPNLGERSNKLQFYLSWFYDWDLMKKH